ncbi:MAG: hypothetical protein DMG32_00770 [Acidobacteria bacterium]|nr:MAG: hypothetical protein DMG32_00770 [Acidobacteriota bacterium]
MNPFDASGTFGLEPQGSGLRHLAVRGAGVSLLSQAFAFVIQMIAIIVLARLVTPADFGLVAMVTTFSLLLTSFGLNGFTEAILQQTQIDSGLISNLFWINLWIGIALTAGFAASGSLLARFYGDSRLLNVTIALSSTILLSSVSVIHLALLKRAMRFSAVSANDMLARAVSVVASIMFAWAGGGYWALVAGAIALPLTATIGAWLQCRWIPNLPRRVVGTAAMVRFAITVYGRFMINYSSRNLDNLLVGWRFNAQSLGFYKKAYDLFVLPSNQLLSPISAVVISTLSRSNRDPLQFKRYFVGTLSVSALVGMGIGGCLTLVAKDLIRLLLGPGWETSGRIFTLFGPGIGVMLIYLTLGWIHLSIGRADRWFRWTVVEFAVTAILFLLALPWGPEGIALAWTASFWILTLPGLWYAGKPIQLGISPVVAAVWKHLAASAIAGCLTLAVLRASPNFLVGSGSLEALGRIVMTSLAFGILYLGVVIPMARPKMVCPMRSKPHCSQVASTGLMHSV